MLSRLLKGTAGLINKGEKLLKRTMNQKAFKYVVFTAYLIASADGDFDNQEKEALVKLIKRDYPDFETKDIIAYIDECDDKIKFNAAMGTQEIVDFLATADSEDSRMIMRVCEYIGAADGTYDKDEKLMARTIAYALNLKPTEFGL